jgi:hypothetical protein
LALLALRAAEHGELECRSRVATEIKRQRLRLLDAETVAALTLPEGKQDVVFFNQDLTGFGFRLRQRSEHLRKSWIVQYQVKTTGRRRRALLGSAAVLSASEARAAARQLLAQVALGRDPQGEKKTKRERTRRRNARLKAAELPAKAIARLLLERRSTRANGCAQKHGQKMPLRKRALDAPLTSLADDQVLDFHAWCQLNRISERTGRRILSGPEGPAVTMLSPRRFGVTVRANREWQRARERRRA